MGNMCTFGRVRKPHGHVQADARSPPAQIAPIRTPRRLAHSGASEGADGRPVRSSALAVGTFTPPLTEVRSPRPAEADEDC